MNKGFIKICKQIKIKITFLFIYNIYYINWVLNENAKKIYMLKSYKKKKNQTLIHDITNKK